MMTVWRLVWDRTLSAPPFPSPYRENVSLV
ncbi:hypothetical protein E2C01_089404 [Portunus trituberculatus]|uniref:Uncharacterized protein n=1 Tax=Portunus trituberculatus TaxID=210409 RepID=A0A5B7JDG0_PORTR|nr:hypothetical protein [Portunus trituberculatus]